MTGTIAKADLVHGAYYTGRCRNATVARWDGGRQLFRHWRSKYGREFMEYIHHPDDEQVYDVFVPTAKIDEFGMPVIPLIPLEDPSAPPDPKNERAAMTEHEPPPQGIEGVVDLSQAKRLVTQLRAHVAEQSQVLDKLYEQLDGPPHPDYPRHWRDLPAKLAEELADDEDLRNRMSELLKGVAYGLKGKPAPRHLHDWSDLPELATHMRALYDAARKLIKAKGRFHTEQHYAALVAAFDATEKNIPKKQP